LLNNIEISKELLSEVLDASYDNTTITRVYKPAEENFIAWETDTITSKYHSINIYELAHKCKEWLKNNVSNANSGFDNGHRNFCHIENYNIQDIFYADTEVEAIIKACEWILKETNAK